MGTAWESRFQVGGAWARAPHGRPVSRSGWSTGRPASKAQQEGGGGRQSTGCMACIPELSWLNMWERAHVLRDSDGQHFAPKGMPASTRHCRHFLPTPLLTSHCPVCSDRASCFSAFCSSSGQQPQHKRYRTAPAFQSNPVFVEPFMSKYIITQVFVVYGVLIY